MTLAAGTRLGRYEVKGLLGAGSMGEVYLALDTQLEREVAVKVLPAEFASDPQRLQRFLQEARAASKIGSAHAAHIYDVGESGGTHFIAMEYVAGEPLSARLGGRQLPAAEVARLGAQVAEALEEAHEKGVTHRDIKPANVVITPKGQAKVLDFGLAKLADAPTGEDPTRVRTDTGAVMGTVSYMSPEQALARPDVDHRTDIWSLGVVLYEMATGRLPFTGVSVTDTIDRIVHSQPEAVARFNYDVPAGLEVAIRKALRKNRDERYQTARDLLNDLRAVERELGQGGDGRPRPHAHDTPAAANEQPTALLHAPPSTGAQPSRASAGDAARVTVEAAAPSTATPKRLGKGRALAFAFALAAAVGAVYALYKLAGTWRQAPAAGAVRVTPLTSSPGVERGVSLSPDGRQVAYVSPDAEGNFDIYVEIVGAGTPLRLTTGPGRDMSPAWSPDGRFIAFERGTGAGKGFYLVPALGGAERKVGEAFGWGRIGVKVQSVDWTPDGKALAVVDKEAEGDPWSVYLLSVETGERRKLTHPPAGYYGDILACVSPDGRSVAFARRHDEAGDVYVVPASGGEPARVTNDDAHVAGLAWAPDGRSLVFASRRSGSTVNLWRIPAAGGAPELVAGAGEDIAELSVARQGGRLAYARVSSDLNIYRMGLVAGGALAPGPPQKFISSTRDEEVARFSPDGTRVAFESSRSGSEEVWVSDAGGERPVQLTSFGGPSVDGPAWSPDGRFLAFHSRAGGSADIYVIGAEGGTPRRLTTEDSREGWPSWSGDRRWVYFTSNRTGRNEVWKMPAGGGEAVQLTRGGGQGPFEAPDGRSVYYTRGVGVPGLWRVGVEGGEESQLFETRVEQGGWALAARGVYYVTRAEAPVRRNAVEFFDFAARRSTRLGMLEGQGGVYLITSLSVSPDERWILYTQRDQLEADLMLVEDFR